METLNEDIIEGNEKKSRTSRFFATLDEILGKSTRLLLWILECAGIIWIGLSMSRFGEALNMIKTADTPLLAERANRYLAAVKTSAESTNAIVIALCAALPGAIGALRAFRKVQKKKNS